ncbi:trans-aconitate 2-methyltransferase [Reyranella sp.]|uniref:class I SAM-dependent methyltransferase n=1 Tax=Reyranella sp. TaxID=1929291 RepID=UPI00120224C8|nr:class I SAM-dependent methyltransferase [Reyranella sp.]TAJ83533.1 MAG: class I SAM-dependent methyltransferase [Reyranella sp.]
MTARHEHWEEVYTTKASTDVSWYQPNASRSLALIRSAAPDHTVPIIDVGGGASTLVDGLLASAYVDLTVLDIAETALDQAKVRLGEVHAGNVAWIAADLLAWTPPRRWAVWHDRAVFHFLVEASQQEVYLATLMAATAPWAIAIFATFAPDGPDKCSGLPVQRYSSQSLADRLWPSFRLISSASEHHTTPWGADQSFAWTVLQRR